MAKRKEDFNPDKYMRLAIQVMKQSIQEPRSDKTSPKVGAVLVKTDETVETAYRGELRQGDHAEFTLLERKNRANLLDGGILFATLEPCAPGARKHPKLGCAERIVNARIRTVYVGIEDPDPTVDRKGIKYLVDNGIEVIMFPPELQKEIREENELFIKQAEERAKQAEAETQEVILSPRENAEPMSDLDDFSVEDINWFLESAKIETVIRSKDFYKIFAQLGFIQLKNDIWIPTGIGLLLFGKNPQLVYQNALIRATFKTKGRGEEIKTVQGSLVRQPDEITKWYEGHISVQIDRSTAKRQEIYDFPLVVLRESIINAIVHRDYDIAGAPIYFEINDDSIIIKSPGAPVEPLKFVQIKSFSAPSLSRNPKIMYVFDQLKLVEQRGLGFETIKELASVHNLPLPIITFEDPYIVITFPRNNSVSEKLINEELPNGLDPKERAAFQWIKENQPISTRKYSSAFNIGYKTAQRMLSRLKERGLIQDNGELSNSPNYKYTIVKESNLDNE